MIRKIVLFIFFIPCYFGFSQQPDCLHGTGISYLSDVFLASLGACNCERAPVFLTSMPDCNTNAYELEFEDNFDSTGLDTSVWEIQPWGQGALLGSQHMEVNLIENATLSNGICYITAKKETVWKRAVNWKADYEILSDGLPNLREYHYTSSNLWTKKKFFYGKYEIRCRMPQGNGLWPAFWMFGGERWNEIDVFDNYGGTSNLISGIGHDFDNNKKSNGCINNKNGFDFAIWHTFTCYFNYNQISIFVDDQLVWVVPRFTTVSGQPLNCGDNISVGTYYQLKSFPAEPMSIIFNMSLIADNNGHFTPVDETTPMPAVFEIDYIKKWKVGSIIEYVQVNPNPTDNGIINLITNSSISSVKIFDTSGKLVFKTDYYDPSRPIDVSQLNNGMYLLSATLTNGIKTIKFIKQPTD